MEQTAGSNNRDKIRYLKQYRLLDAEINRLVGEAELWRRRLGRITATVSDIPGGGGSIYKSTDHDIIIKIVELEDKINDDLDRLLILKDTIKTAINNIRDGRERLVMQYRYLDDMRFESIAVEMNYNYRWVRRLHDRALEKIVIMY